MVGDTVLWHLTFQLSDGVLSSAEAPCRRVPDHVSLSRISYFKRKFVDDDEPPLSFRSYCQTVSHDTLLYSAPHTHWKPDLITTGRQSNHLLCSILTSNLLFSLHACTCEELLF